MAQRVNLGNPDGCSKNVPDMCDFQKQLMRPGHLPNYIESSPAASLINIVGNLGKMIYLHIKNSVEERKHRMDDTYMQKVRSMKGTSYGFAFVNQFLYCICGGSEVHRH